jgi:hypothetical protein
MKIYRTLVAGSFCIAALGAWGATRYVDVNNLAPSPPYLSWASAARVIQDAVDAAAPGDIVLVTNGVYETGGRVGEGLLTNRVAILKPLSLQSVNGAAVTIIKGWQVPGTTNGDEAVRCVYLTNGASVSGFTLASGATRSIVNYSDHFGGGVLCQSTNTLVSDCILTANSAHAGGGGAYGGTLSNCTLTANRAQSGGGSAEAVLIHCQLLTNIATGAGGGAFYSVLVNCRLTANVAGSNGGGVAGSSLSNCVIEANIAGYSGGGAADDTLQNCVIIGNSAVVGGGICEGILQNCLLANNWATDSGGGAYAGRLFNCTITGNSATNRGGGGYGFDSFHMHANCVLYNSIIYSNQAALSKDCACTQYDSCLPAADDGHGDGNIHSPPQFVAPQTGDFRLSSASPCINSGNPSWLENSDFTNRLDLDGNLRVAGGAVDLGAYEVQNPPSIISLDWLASYALPTDGSADFGDPDGDGLNNYGEWQADTNPTNPLSTFKLLAPVRVGGSVNLTWTSVYDRVYDVERSTSLSAPFSIIATGLRGGWDTTTFIDSDAPTASTLLYRVRVAGRLRWQW